MWIENYLTKHPRTSQCPQNAGKVQFTSCTSRRQRCFAISRASLNWNGEASSDESRWKKLHRSSFSGSSETGPEILREGKQSTSVTRIWMGACDRKRSHLLDDVKTLPYLKKKGDRATRLQIKNEAKGTHCRSERSPQGRYTNCSRLNLFFFF